MFCSRSAAVWLFVLLTTSGVSCSDDDATDGNIPVYAGPLDADGGGPASWLMQDGDAVFFIGNSFFDYQGRVLPDWVTAVGQSVVPSRTIETGSYIVPGTKPLSWFYSQKASKDAIASGKYKLYVVQGEETEPIVNKANFQDAVRDYHRAITDSGARMLLFMTWDFAATRNRPDFFRQLSSAYEEIGAELHVPVIPVGLIWDDCNKQPYPGEQPYFLNAQELHQTEKGTAVNAYATFSMLTGVDPMGVQFKANGNTNSPDVLQYLSDRAWYRVAMRLHD